MALSLLFSDDGVEVRVVVNWERLKAFIRNLVVTLWFALSLLAALRAAGLDLSWLFGL